MADDAVQQAGLIALGHASPPAEANEQRAWIRGILKNVIRREWRSRSRADAAMHRSGISRVGAGSFQDEDPDEHENRSRLVHALYLAVTDLSQMDQDLFYAFYREGRSQQRIADELGVTTKGIEMRLYRLRTRLRAALAECEVFPT